MRGKEKEETIERLKARLECDVKQVKGIAEICNPPYMCEDCDLCYAQGTMGQRNIDLEKAIEVLSVNAIPIEWIKNYINSIGGSNGVTKLHKEILKTMLKDWEKENERL